MSVPRATYRMQLHAGFGFADAAACAPYLAALGISHLYVSPILTARQGSPHGYDVVDPTRVDPKLGGEDGFRAMVVALRAAGLGLIVDIVPNHMAVGTENPWWQDVLAQGARSRWAAMFDIDWQPEDPALRGKLLCPFLDRPYGEALAAGALVLVADGEGFAVRHHDGLFPIAAADRAEIARHGLGAFDAADPDGRARLHDLLERQHWRLAWWRTAGDAINWRRFFDIGELVGVRVEDPVVFDATHALLLRLYGEGAIDGFRVDHVDGLADPAGYCRELRRRMDAIRPGWLVVEKILGAGEALATDWGTDGTTGYDFLDEVSGLLHDPGGEPALTILWTEATGRPAAFSAEETAARREIIARSFTAQRDAVAAALHRIARADPATRDCTHAAIGRSLVALLARFSVYRTYGTPADRPVIAHALAAAMRDVLPGDRPVLDRVAGWLGAPTVAGEAIRRFRQLSAPVAAKAVEDTAFYRYGRLLSRNDVGTDPGVFALPAVDFHERQRRRLAGFPAALLATATHDHKRGEDVRARLAVLSELPGEWSDAVADWLPRDAAPTPGDAMMLCQMIVGAWPLDLDPGDGDACGRFAGRLAAWQRKALREAKLATDWTEPDPAYEAAAAGYLDRLMSEPATRIALAAFAGRIAPAGAVNGLAQLLLRLTAPGVPDTYQGTEFWDFSLVDPDNRRPVDFAPRAAALATAVPVASLAACWRDGRIKQAVLARTLALRRSRPAPFAAGGYEVLAANGPHADHVVAFARRHADATVVTVVPRWTRYLLEGEGIALGAAGWEGTRLRLPAGRSVREVLTDRLLKPDGGAVPVADLLGPVPVALLEIA